MAADGGPDLGAPAASMDSLPEGEPLPLGIKPANYTAQENGGESAEDTGHSRRRFGDGQSIHGDTVRPAPATAWMVGLPLWAARVWHATVRMWQPVALCTPGSHGCLPS